MLTSLGPPTQWTESAKALPKDRLHVRLERDVVAGVRETQRRIASGGWGMPLLIGLLTFVGMLAFYDGGIVLVGIAYFFARSVVTYAPESLAGRQRWYVYAPLALGAGSLTALVLLFPVMLEIGSERGPHGSFFSPMTMWVLGLWWMFVGFIAGREVKRVRTLLKPFADGFEGSHARMLILIGAAFMIASFVDLLPTYLF